MVTPRQTCAPSAIAHPINAAVVSLEPSFGSTEAEWLTVDGNAFTLTSIESARDVATETAAKYERIAAGLRAFAGEPGACEWPALRWPWPCDDNASTVLGTGAKASAWRARRRHLRSDVCPAVPRMVQP